MKYTEYAIKDGTKLRCTKSGTYNRWVEGDIYTVENEGIFDSDGNHIGNYYILYCLNEQDSNVKFEIVKEEEKVEYTEKDLKAGMKLRCTKATPTHWTVGKVYELSLSNSGTLEIKDDNGDGAFTDYILDCLNGNHKPVEFEVAEEKPERLVKVAVLQEGTPDADLLKVGGIYKVMGDASIGRGVNIYLDERPDGYYLHPNQFVFVKEPSNDGEKEVEEELDAEAKILAKIEQLTAEAVQLFAKRDRVHEQAVNLNAKARRLEESLELLREYM